MERKVTFTANQHSSSIRGLKNHKSFDDSLCSLRRRRFFSENTEIRRVQSVNEERKKTTRRLKVICKVKSKMIMFKVKLSSPTTSPDILQQYDIAVKGANCSKLGTPKHFEKTCEVFFFSPNRTEKQMKNAEIIVKEKETEAEHIRLVEVLASEEARVLNKNMMNLTTSKPEWTLPDVRIFNNDGSLCEKEKEFLRQRKTFIQKALKKPRNKLDETDHKRPLDEDELVNCPDDVPHIALMGSGGGFRAMIAMSGIFNALYDTGLLHVILYTAVLSGSSWYIATLYSHPDWPNVNPHQIQTDMKKDLLKNNEYLSKFLQILGCGAKEMVNYFLLNNWNFTMNVFGKMLGNFLISDRMESKLSDQASKMSEGTAPLPLLSAIHAKPKENARKFHEWVEFSPYEASIPKYGAAIKMKHFGSEFSKGQLIKETETELRLYEIMGICGSAFAITYDELQNRDDQSNTESDKKLAFSSTDGKGEIISDTLENKNGKDASNIHDIDLSLYERNAFDEQDWPKNNTKELGTDELDGEHRKHISDCLGHSDLNECKTKTSSRLQTTGSDKLDVHMHLYNMNYDEKTFDELDGYKSCNYRNNSTDEHAKGNAKLDVLEGGSIAKQPNKQSNISDNANECDEIDEILKFNEHLASHEQTTEDLQELKIMFQRFCKIQENNDRNPFSTDDVFNNCKQNGPEGKDEVDGFPSCFRECYDSCVKWALEDRLKLQRAAVVNNFMRKVSFYDEENECLKGVAHSPLFENYMKRGEMEKLCLIDAGLAFNSPYPLLFKSGRDIDLILSFDFTDRKADVNSPFETILRAEEWARTHEIKFPKVKEAIEENRYAKKEIQELYVFEDESDMECPIIMHFVLVNKAFRHFEKPNVERNSSGREFADFTIYDKPSAFNCTNFCYTKKNFERLSSLSEFIVLNNQKEIEKYIQKSIARKSKILRKRRRSRHPTS